MNRTEVNNKLMQILTYVKNPKIMIAGAVVVICALLVLFFSGNKISKEEIAANQQVWSLADNIRQHYRSRPDAWGLSTASVIQNNMAEQNMLAEKGLKNALGKDVLVGSDMDGNVVMPGSRSFIITYNNLNYNECVNMAASALSEKEQLSLTSMVIANENEHRFVWGGENPLPISKSAAQNRCKKNNKIAWFLYI